MENEDHRMLSLVLELAWHIVLGLQPTDSSVFVPQFDEHCLSYRESVLITSPNLLWSSSMKNTIKFKEVDSYSDWVAFCVELLNNFARRTE